MSAKLLNKSEQATFDRVWKVAESNFAHVNFKIRLKDVLKAMNASLLFNLEAAASTNAAAQADFSFALKAHLDFLVYDAYFHPLFAVEFDGRYHETDPQQQRCDRRKNALMKRFGLPLLRIEDHYLDRKYRGFDLLTYFVELWFWCDSYVKELKPLVAPYSDWEEAFNDPQFALETGRHPRYYLISKIEDRIRSLLKTRSTPNYWIGRDAFAGYHCIMWILLPGGGYCFVERSIRSEFPVPTSFILAQITACKLLERIQSDGERAARTNMELQERLAFYARHFAHQGSRRSLRGGL